MLLDESNPTYRLCNLDFVMQDAHHQLPVVAHDWALTGGEPMTLRPAQADADAECAGLCICVDSARIIRYVEAGYSQSAAGTSDLHYRIEHGKDP
jgi:hypothetical protein